MKKHLWSLARATFTLVFCWSLGSLPTGCMPNLRAAVSLRVSMSDKTPGDASVVIDEQYIGPLAYVAARGVRLPEGKHRITVTRDGYFPWDRLVTAGTDDIRLNVALVRIPD